MQFDKAVIIVGKGDIHWPALRAVSSRYDIIALDGAYDQLVANQFIVSAVIGDLDSLSARDDINTDKVTIIAIEEQDSNDFEKAIYSITAPAFLCFGLTGKRFDHTIANLHVMAKYSDSNKLIAITCDEVITIHRGDSHLEAKANALFAILPLMPITFVSSSGLAYPLDGLALAIGQMVSSSNHATTDMVTLQPAESDSNLPYAICRPLSLFEEGVISV